MRKAEALLILSRMHRIKQSLADAPRDSRLSRAMGAKHREEAQALAVAITELSRE